MTRRPSAPAYPICRPVASCRDPDRCGDCQERAAIAEHDGHLSRAEADRLATAHATAAKQGELFG
jgi:hypothetical protein